MKSLLMLVIFVAACSFQAYAATYEWVDDNGVINFTDNPDNIPAKYLKKVKKRPSVDFEGTAPQPSVKTEKKAPVSPKTEPAVRSEQKLFGGHDEEWWRNRFSGPRKELKGIQDKLPEKREELTALRRKMVIYMYTRDRTAYYDKLAEIQKDEERIKELNNRLDSIDIEASKAGIPFEWRK